jgi:hypothetical protein
MSIRKSLGKLLGRKDSMADSAHAIFINNAFKEVGFVPDPGTILMKQGQGICAHCGNSLPDRKHCPRNYDADRRLTELGVVEVTGCIFQVHNCPSCGKPVRCTILTVKGSPVDSAFQKGGVPRLW